MALRRPLVIDGNEIKELPIGDTLPGAGGGTPVESAVLAVPTVANAYSEQTVARPGTAPANAVLAWFAHTPDQENDIEELSDSAMRLQAIPEVDQVRFILASDNNSKFVGPYNIKFQVHV
jgi:hypothetical protein